MLGKNVQELFHQDVLSGQTRTTRTIDGWGGTCSAVGTRQLLSAEGWLRAIAGMHTPSSLNCSG